MKIREYMPKERSIYAVQFNPEMDEGAVCAFTNHQLKNIRNDLTFDGKMSGELSVHEGVSTYVFEGDYIYKDVLGMMNVMSEKNFQEQFELKE